MPHFNNLAVFFNIVQKTARLVKSGIPNSLIDQLLCITPKKIYSSSIIPQVAGYSCPEEEFGFLGGDLVDVFFIFRFLFSRWANFVGVLLISNSLATILLMIF